MTGCIDHHRPRLFADPKQNHVQCDEQRLNGCMAQSGTFASRLHSEPVAGPIGEGRNAVSATFCSTEKNEIYW